MLTLALFHGARPFPGVHQALAHPCDSQEVTLKCWKIPFALPGFTEALHPWEER